MHLIALAILLVGIAAFGFVRLETRGPADDLSLPLSDDQVSGAALIETTAASPLSDLERAGLVFMREEEKLARDVYALLGERTGLRIFSNIAASEQTHMDAVGTLLARYEVADPVVDPRPGAFTDATLAALYADLVAQAAASDIKALRVGALIEDLDIADLALRLGQTDNPDIRLVYENLMRGSRNHLRSFVSQLQARGATYEPVYISPDGFAAIIASPRERGGQY